ncbi:MAG: hypothetical protein EHM17_08040 [Verrucomicrobiaceae bacterium]|nr:MAG: hypothetical protein EHM17_08040 [Verrucomicrobiaceae bacterium]
MRGDGIRVVEIEGLDRPGAQGGECGLTVLAGNFPGAHQWLERCGKQAPRHQIQHAQSAGRRQGAQQPPQRVIDHRGGIDLAAEGRVQRDELVACSQVMLDAREQVGLAMAGARGAQQDAATGFLHRHRENFVKGFVGPPVHRLRVGGGETPEGFKKHLKGMFAGHDSRRLTAGETACLSRPSQERSRGPAWIPSGISAGLCLDRAMQSYLIMTVLGSDRPGLVRSLADTVAKHGGNWLESRMARLAGQFAGIVRIECPAAAVDELLRELQSPGVPGLTVQAVREIAGDAPARRTLAVEVVGNDRPGIVRELTAAIAGAGGNVEELTTGLESAPMSGHPMFRAKGVVSIPENAEPSALTAAIESLGGDLTVDITV